MLWVGVAENWRELVGQEACDRRRAEGDAEELRQHGAHLVVNDLGELVS